MSVYSDYSRDKIGFFFGLTGAQLAILVGAALPILAAVGASRWLLAVGLVVVWGLVFLLVAVPVHGRPAVGWAGAGVRFVVGRVTGWSEWRSGLTRGQVGDLQAPDLPGALHRLGIHEGHPQPPSMRRVAIIQDQASRAWAVTAAVTHRGITTATDHERTVMGRGLSELLDVCSRGELACEVLFVVRTVPDDGAERAQWVARHRTGRTPASQVNDELATALTGASVRTEAFLTVVVPESRISRRARDAGGGLEGRSRVLALLMAEVEAHLLGSMGFQNVSWLTSPELAIAVRTGFAPSDRAGIIHAQTEHQTNPQVNATVPWSQAGPSGATTLARCYTHDAWASVSVGLGLPDRGALAGALAPVLTPTQPHERRTLVVAYPIKSHHKAEREIGTGEWIADMGEAMRDSAKMKARAKDRTNLTRRRTLDAKLAAGNSLTTPYAVCTVTVPNTYPIGDFTHQLEASVRRAGFAPQVLDLAQDVAFATSSLPLGISLARSTT